MKKVIFLFLILALMFTFVACRANVTDGTSSPSPTDSIIPSPTGGDIFDNEDTNGTNGANGNNGTNGANGAIGGDVNDNNDLKASPNGIM